MTASSPPCPIGVCVSEEPVPQACGRVAGAWPCCEVAGDILYIMALALTYFSSLPTFFCNIFAKKLSTMNL